MHTFLKVVCFCFILQVVRSKSVPVPLSHSLASQNVEMLDEDGKFILGWEISGDEIIFEVEAATLGYVGFGISPNGGMTNADIFLAGVFPNGTSYAQDRFGVGNQEPVLDEQQDWTLLAAMELPAAGKTILKFKRRLNTCDDMDYPIGNDTNRLIWSMGQTDNIAYHSTNRGTKSTNLIYADLPELNFDEVQSWSMKTDMEMPKQDTSYWCTFHKGPELMTKHHVVGFSALLPSADAVRHTHHFILYNCYVPPGSNQTADEVFGDFTIDKGAYGDHCYESVTEYPIQYCHEYLYVWAKGGKLTVFPDDVGYPIGEQPGSQYYMVEIHYDNPNELAGVKFETGLTFYYTDRIRTHDAGLLTLGHDVEISLTVPPNHPDYMVVGHCSPECTEKFTSDGITVFNSLLHAHLSGRKIKTRQFRGNKELPWLDFDDHYDFDYQQNKLLRETIKILPGDQITVECVYDSTWKNGEIVIGGLGAREEMCQEIVWYYPRQDIDVCGSQYDVDQHLKEFGVTNYTVEFTNLLNKYTILSPESLAGDYFDSITHKFNWTQEFLQEYTFKRQTGVHFGDCMIRRTGEIFNYDVAYPATFEEYVPDEQCTA